jgi:hypothetical protein
MRDPKPEHDMHDSLPAVSGAPLRAWRGRQSRDVVLATARAHLAADLLAHGATGNVLAGERGCSVACTVGTYDHSRYPAELGLPEWLAYLQDTIYERLPRDDRGLDVAWTIDLLSAIPEGAEVDLALRPILARILDEVALPAVTVDRWGVRDAIGDVIAALRGEPGSDLAEAAAEAAEAADAAEAAEAAEAAAAAAEAAEAEAAAEAAARAAVAAVAAVAAAARAAVDAAWAAAWAAVDAVDAAAWAAEAAAWERIRAIVLDELGRLEGEEVTL